WHRCMRRLPRHRTGEDALARARMRHPRSACRDDVPLWQPMEDEHGRIDPLVDSVDDALADPDHGHEQLADTVDALTAELSGHLAHEERDTLPLLERSLSQAEWPGFRDEPPRESRPPRDRPS